MRFRSSDQLARTFRFDLMKTSIRQYLVYLIIALMTTQSVGAMADVHKFHQSGTEHLSFNHEHSSADIDVFELHELDTSDALSSDSFDCHHCCHCHGVASVFIGAHWAGLPFAAPSEEQSFYHFVSLPFQKSPDTPPPIS